MEPTISVSVAPHIFSFGNFSLTNSFLATILITIGIFILSLFVRKSMRIVPSRIQFFFEQLYDYFAEQSAPAFGEDKTRAKQITILMASLFVFLILVNQFSIFPLFSQIQWGGDALFRTPTTDLNLPFALTLVVLGWTHVIAFIASPVGHVGKFINLSGFKKIKKPGDIGTALIDFFLGILDIVGEVSKVLSLSFRLFGNMLAGEIIILIIAGISAYTSYLVPIPFIVLSIFSGVVQAFVFAILCLNFVGAMVPPSRQFRKRKQAVEPARSSELVA
jgi:F-type H+-transporting ATPase subunit a